MPSIRRDGAALMIEGAIHMNNARALLSEAQGLLGPEVNNIDLAGVTDVDSAAVSLLLEWQRQAARQNRTLRFTNLPQNVRSLADLYGVTQLIPQ